MSNYIDADFYVGMEIHDDEHEEWRKWNGTIESLLNQWTDQGCPPKIEVSEDCVSREWVKKKMLKYGFLAPDMTVTEFIEDAPSVVPSRAEGEWQITDAYPHNVYCSECHKKFAQTHWAVWEDGSLPRNFCPNCGARMETTVLVL